MHASRHTPLVRVSCVAFVVGVTVSFAGCAVGPNFVRPSPPDVSGYTSTPTPASLASGDGEVAQRLSVGKTITADWWTLFESPRLQQVVEDAVDGNRTLAAAKATLAQARETVLQLRGAYYPQVDAVADAERDANLFRLGATVSYMPDVFGLTRRRVEQQQALAENQGFQFAAAYLTLTGNAVSQAIDIASARTQVSAAEDVVVQDERNYDLVRRRYEAGKAAQAEVLLAESQLANDRTQIPPLRQQLGVARHALSVLVGRFPAQWVPPDFELTEFELPVDLPVSLPSELVRQRPDILAAEAQLHAASAAIGVSVAQMYPSITLSASGGLDSSSISSLFTASSLAWDVIGGVTAPIFHGGSLEAQKRAAIDAFDGSLATYQQVVLQAFEQVADTLLALQHDAELVAAERAALDTATTSVELQRVIYEAGKSDLLSLLAAQRAYEEARLAYVRAQAQRYQDTAALFVALGGGWWKANERTGLPSGDARTARPETTL